MSHTTGMVPLHRKLSLNRIGLTLTMVLILLAILPSTLLFVFIVQESNRQAYQQAVNQLSSIAEFRSIEIEHTLGDGQEVLMSILEDTLQAARIVTTAEVRDRRLAPASQVDSYLRDMLGKQNTLKSFFLYTLNGEVRSATNASLVGQSVADAPYFANSLEEDLIHPFHYDENTRQVHLVVTQVVTTISGKAVGVLAGEFEMSVFYDLLTSREGLGETGETYLVSAQNSYLLSPSRFEGVALGTPIHTQAVERVVSGESGSAIYQDYRGREVIGVHRLLPQIQAVLLAELDVDEAFHAGRQIQNIGLITGGLSLASVIVVGTMVTGWITRPLSILTQTATLVADGDYSQRAHVKSRNEIGQLAQAFNRMTDQLVQVINELDKRVEELKIATMEAKEASRLKDEFLAIMSHELRTPLNAIIGFSGLMIMRNTLDEKSAAQTKRIRVNAERLLSLIDDILDISRIESGRVELVPEKLDLKQFIETMRGQMTILAEQKELEFSIQYDETLPTVILIDDDAFTKIVSNLLSNAFKFTEKGSVQLVFRQSSENELSIDVCDTGIGIPIHKQEIIFERFRQVDGSFKRAYGGTGLGLSIVQQLCQIMKGTISVESEPGKGSTFSVILPFARLDHNVE